MRSDLPHYVWVILCTAADSKRVTFVNHVTPGPLLDPWRLGFEGQASRVGLLLSLLNPL